MKPTWFVQRLASAVVRCVLLGVLVSGCAYVRPDPARENLNEEAASRIIPGKTTRLEVVAMLGQPDEVLDGGKQFTYVKKYELALIPTGGPGAGKRPDTPNRYVLKVEFDERDIVSRRDFNAPYEFHDRPLQGISPTTSHPAWR